jgi:hypothetical protein
MNSDLSSIFNDKLSCEILYQLPDTIMSTWDMGGKNNEISIIFTLWQSCDLLLSTIGTMDNTFTVWIQ